jgi:hypothetical protein
MITIRPLFLGVFLAAVTALLTGCATQPRPEPLAITVLRLKGEARASMDGKTWQPLKKGDVVKVGAVIQTAPKSLVDICFGEKPSEPTALRPSTSLTMPSAPHFKTTRIFENSALKIEQAVKRNRYVWSHWSDKSLKEEIKIDLRAGEIMGTTISSSENPKYLVGFSQGVITFPRNAAYMLSTSGIFRIVNGAAFIFLADKNLTLEVASGREYDPVSGTVTDMSLDAIRALSSIIEPRWDPQFQFVTQPSTLGHGPGMGGALRKF